MESIVICTLCVCVCALCIYILGWPYVPFFLDMSWPGFLYCLKYLSFGFVCVCRPIGVWHQSTIQTVPYVFKTLSRYFDVKHWSVWATLLLSRTHLICTCNCIALTVDPTFSHTPWLVHYVQCLHVIGQTTFRSLPSASMKTGKQSQNKSWQGYVWEKWHVWSP